MTKLATKQKRRKGDVVSINLGSGLFAYGQVLEDPLMRFFDYIASEALPSEQVVKRPELFLVSVMHNAVKSGRWPIVGHADSSDADAREIKFFKRDALDGSFSISFQDGTERPATKEECAELECDAVWSAEHVEDRLRDHFAGRPNISVLSLRRGLD